jgi:hypothetical protein
LNLGNTSRSATPNAWPSRRGHLGGLRGDSFDNAMAESLIGTFKAELIHTEQPARR